MAIHEQNYVRYEGALHEGRAARVIALSGLGTFWSFLRTKLVLLGLWLVPVGWVIAVFIEYSVRNSQLGAMGGVAEQAPSGGPIVWFIYIQMISLAILFITSGCGVVSDDLRYRTVQLYFSKPLTRLDYGLGKFGSLFLLGSLITIVPGLLVSMLRMGFWARTDFAAQVAGQMATGMGIMAVATALMCLIVMGLSSLTAHTRYVVLAWIGVLLVPTLISFIMEIATEGNDASGLWSITGNIQLVSKHLLTEEELSVPLIAPVAILLALGAAGAGAVGRRITKLEGVA